MKKCYLHIGNFKTGSTSLQKFFFINKDLLSSHNIEPIYEENFFGKAINHEKLYKQFDTNNLNELNHFFSNINTEKNIILSSEYFSCFSKDIKKIKFLKETIEKFGFELIVIFYYRKDIDYLYSLYSEMLKHRKWTKIDNVFDFKKKVFNYGYYYLEKKSINWYLNTYYFVNYKLVEEVWKSVFKNKFYSIEYNPDDNLKIFKDFINIIGTKDISNYKIPEKVNVRGKISPWKLKRIFNFIYLKFNTKKYFNLI